MLRAQERVVDTRSFEMCDLITHRVYTPMRYAVLLVCTPRDHRPSSISTRDLIVITPQAELYAVRAILYLFGGQSQSYYSRNAYWQTTHLVYWVVESRISAVITSLNQTMQ